MPKQSGVEKQTDLSLKENTTHGTVSLPVALYEAQGEKECHVVPHWHEEMELVYFKSGTFPVWLNTKEFDVKAPAIMCVYPEELHGLMLGKKCQESAIVFPLEIVSFEHYDAIQAKLIRPLLDGRLRMPVLFTKESPIFEDVRRIYEEMEQRIRQMNACSMEQEIEKNAAYLQIKALLLELFALLYQKELFAQQEAIRREDEISIENLKKVISYIGEHYDSVIRLDELATLVNMNPQYFCRYFKKNIGKTITEYINVIRIEKAATALLETQDKIIDIATDCGFENVGYFIRRFKKEKGVTPSEYREKSK